MQCSGNQEFPAFRHGECQENNKRIKSKLFLEHLC
nr:MAG TPA: hypothetical protein [Caudoviricetes sp.]